ncbi:MAG: ATP synthase F1 subunit delta [Chitinophagales bacterium]|nr:ATP synthase F1 subunit delta [Chitinophagales bacterium]MDW8428863.1 ATP synthase F1 subunit delta [Chitinophagales bacterium]
MRNTKVGYRYAKALIELAQQMGAVDAVKTDLDFLRNLRNKDLEALIASPVIQGERKAKIFRSIFSDKLHPLTLNFFDLVFRKGREFALHDITQAFDLRYYQIKNIAKAKVITAVPLSDVLFQEIHQAVASLPEVQGKNLELETEVNPAIIGGFILQLEDKKYDASVRRQLQVIKQDFIENLYKLRY